MARFVPKDKLSKKAQKELNRQRRVIWDFSPVTKTVDSKKLYNRKRSTQNRDDYGLGVFLFPITPRSRQIQSRRSSLPNTAYSHRYEHKRSWYPSAALRRSLPE